MKSCVQFCTKSLKLKILWRWLVKTLTLTYYDGIHQFFSISCWEPLQLKMVTCKQWQCALAGRTNVFLYRIPPRTPPSSGLSYVIVNQTMWAHPRTIVKVVTFDPRQWTVIWSQLPDLHTSSPPPSVGANGLILTSLTLTRNKCLRHAIVANVHNCRHSHEWANKLLWASLRSKVWPIWCLYSCS